MAITSGFYNSPSSSDRRLYYAHQMGEMFDGIITDGIFPNVGNAFNITTVSGALAIKVGSGRAWFKNTWTYNDAEITINLAAAHSTYHRYDLLVLKIDKTPSVAKNTIEIIQGTPASSPVVPTVTNTANVFYYVLAQFYIPAGTTDSTKMTITKYIGTDSVPFVRGIASIDNFSPEQHNNIYRGKSLGSAMTAEQYASIQNGTFKDLFIGDYWSTSGGIYRIAGFNYWYGKGDQALNKPHVVIVNEPIGQATTTSKRQWAGEDVRTSSKGYMYSTIRYECSDHALRIQSSGVFPSGSLISHREYIQNSVNNIGYHTGGDWSDSRVEMLSEIMVFGCHINAASVGNNIGNRNAGRYTISTTQLPLFRIAPSFIKSYSGHEYWLRDLSLDNYACTVNQYGLAATSVTQNELLPRYVFAIG